MLHFVAGHSDVNSVTLCVGVDVRVCVSVCEETDICLPLEEHGCEWTLAGHSDVNMPCYTLWLDTVISTYSVTLCGWIQ